MTTNLEWKVLESKELYRAGLFRLRGDRCELPDHRVMPRYYVMEFLNWVNIVPLTTDRKIVLVEQYRHAAAEVFLEIPGGSMDLPIDGKSEDPLEAAVRELREETGYVPTRTELVCSHFPNPSMQNNLMHTFIGYDCKLVQAPEPDQYEDIRVVTKTIPEVVELLLSGQMTHSIVTASLLYALPKLGIQLK